ncbi:TRAP transporter small permease subunit [Sedimentitalea sp. XS_ASV28]|uniref:TRAP transporter small permease subunit n=1 Tax=Sedimentitalea sp. XS_ASV28 TaxID=3241296 RepID=UPI0035133B6A
MAVIGTVDVLGTTLFDKPLAGTFEMSEQAMAAVIFLGLLHTQIMQRHIVVDVLTERFKGRTALVSTAFSVTATAVALGLIAAQTWPLFTASWAIKEQASGLLGFPVWPVKGLVCAGALSAAAVAAIQSVQAWSRVILDRSVERRR